MYQKYQNVFKEIVKFIGEIDVIKSCALTAINNHYYQPVIDTNSSDSFIEATGIRHPLIEKINTKVPYIPHDIVLEKIIKTEFYYLEQMPLENQHV